MEEYKYFVAGECKKSSQKISVINPVTEEAFAYIFEATEQDLDAALTQARTAQSQWRATPFKERAQLLRQIAKVMLDNLSELARIETQETGKIFKESLFVDVPLGADCFNYYASFLESLQDESCTVEGGIDTLSWEPFGRAAVYLPYNVPLMIFGFSCAAALAAGNALIIKPSEFGSLSLLTLARHLSRLDMPKGLINIVTGFGSKVGAQLAQSSVELISFTGSRATVKKIVAQSARNPKKIICELGGCNILAVFSDCDFEEALQNILASSFMKQGQMCIGTSMVLIEDTLYERAKKKLLAMVKEIKIGQPFDSTVGMGPLPAKTQLAAVGEKVKDICAQGGTILCGGKPLDTKGYFYPPTIIEIKEPVYEELFAPVIMLAKANAEEMEAIIERNPSGLVLQIWSGDLARAQELARSVACGTVWINSFAQMNSQTPFGGMKSSGWGRNLGKSGFFEYVQPKHTGIGLSKTPVSGWFGV